MASYSEDELLAISGPNAGGTMATTMKACNRSYPQSDLIDATPEASVEPDIPRGNLIPAIRRQFIDERIECRDELGGTFSLPEGSSG